MTRAIRQRDGFSIIEVLIGLTIFAIGVLGIGAMQISAIRGNQTSQRFTEAVSLATDRMETLINLPYNDAELIGEHSASTGPYTVSWEVDADTPIGGCKTIRLTVSWQDHDKARSIGMDYVKSEG